MSNSGHGSVMGSDGLVFEFEDPEEYKELIKAKPPNGGRAKKSKRSRKHGKSRKSRRHRKSRKHRRSRRHRK